MITINRNQITTDTMFSMPLRLTWDGIEYEKLETVRISGEIVGWMYFNYDLQQELYIIYN